MPPNVSLRWRNVEAVPLIHGRLPFALWVRERMLETRYAAVAVELPQSLRESVMKGVRDLPTVTAVVYRESPGFLGSEAPDFLGGRGEDPEQPAGPPAWYVPIDPCDGIVEALRIADRERTPVHFVDAEVEQFAGRTLAMPDPHALLTLGLESWYQTLVPALRKRHPATTEDLQRESHMAGRLDRISAEVGDRGKVLFLCGIAHWERIRGRLDRGDAALADTLGPDESLIGRVAVGARSLFAFLGETPFVTWHWERHRSGFDLDRHDPLRTLKELLLDARGLYEKEEERSLERATPAALARTLDYVRRLTVRHHRLTPDLYSLIVGAKGVVGNDFALAVLEVAGVYPPNERFSPPGEVGPFTQQSRRLRGVGDGGGDAHGGSGGNSAEQPEGTSEFENSEALEFAHEERGILDGRIARIVSRTPGESRQLRRVRLEARPPEFDRNRWKTAWNPFEQCSFPPEDLVIENLRSYISSRALNLAGLDLVRTEEFQSSLKDGLDLRETLRDLPRGKLHVKVEPRVPGKVGAVVLIFEEDDAGERYPWRTTWMAENFEESTLAFYATDFQEDVVGPGIARARYGGCMMIYPPIGIPDVWEDLRFERARRPSERLLLAAAYWGGERFVTYVADRPPRPEVRSSVAALGKHVIHLPLSSFSARTLEKVRTVHVLNGRQVRSWAARFIR